MANENNSNREIGERLRQIRNEKGLTQEEFGAPLEYSKNSISSIETGAANISKRGIFAFCYWYDLSLEWVLYGKGPKYAETKKQKEIIKIFNSLDPDLQDFYVQMVNELNKLNKKRDL